MKLSECKLDSDGFSLNCNLNDQNQLAVEIRDKQSKKLKAYTEEECVIYPSKDSLL